MNDYMDAMRRYADFTGRSTRRQYWIFVLVVFVLVLIGVGVDAASGEATYDGLGIVASLIALVHLLPVIAVSIRRLHDSGRSGWWYLINLIPLGVIVFVFLMCVPSVPDGNAPATAEHTSPVLTPAASTFRTAEADGFKSPMFGHYQQPPRQEPPMRPNATPAVASTSGNAPVPAVAAPPAAEASTIDQLERLAALRASGGLTDEEFFALKANLMSKANQQ